MSYCNCDTRPVRFVLVKAVLTHHSCVANILSFIKGNIVRADDPKGTRSSNPLLFEAHGYFTNSLTKSN